MMITEEGIVLRERTVGEQDKFIDILTKTRGVLELRVRGARKITGKSGSSSQLFAYSRFCIDRKGDRLFLNSAEPIHIFYGLRDSLSKIALASYFAETLAYCVTPEKQSEDVARLTLNCLSFLETGKRPEALLKAIFELRLASELGFTPDIVACKVCGAFEPEELFFSLEDGSLVCSEHGESPADSVKMKTPTLRAIRHIVLADFDRLFNFRLSEEPLRVLSYAAESYFLRRLERGFRTLDFYKELI